MPPSPTIVSTTRVHDHLQDDMFQVRLGGTAVGPALPQDDARTVADWLAESWRDLEDLL